MRDAYLRTIDDSSGISRDARPPDRRMEVNHGQINQL
jgi:hypothetical protein